MEEQLRGGRFDPVEILEGEKKKDADFFAFAEEQIVLKKYAPETRRMYRVYLEKIKVFRSSLKVSQIDFTFLRSYEAHLRDSLKNSENTIWENFKFINTITNDAIKAKVLTVDPFKTFKRVKYNQSVRTFLNADELTDRRLLKEAESRLLIVDKYFLFSCYTGLSYSDACRFRIQDHVINNERIVMKTQKTGKETNLYINDKIRPLMQYVNDNPLKLSRVEFNRRLKEIAAGSKIKKQLSSHVARHSFGSSLVDLGIPIEVAKGLLSHGSTSSTKIYYHLKSANLDEAMKKFIKNNLFEN
jgi:site-specific recombinase XerD